MVEWFPKFKAKRFMTAQGLSSSLAFDFDQFSEVFTAFDKLHFNENSSNMATNKHLATKRTKEIVQLTINPCPHGIYLDISEI